LTLPRFERSRHHEVLCRALEDVEAGLCDRLIVMMPPRQGKSELSSRRFPAWYIGRKPTRRVIMASYGEDLVTRHSRVVRDLLLSDKHHAAFPECQLSTESQSVTYSTTTAGGELIAAGIRGPLTGSGADCLIIDDYLKDDIEAQSELIRDQNYEWMTGVAYGRLEPGSAVVIVATRWHQDDLIGRMLEFHADENWRVIRMPALAERPKGEPDEYGFVDWREQGEGLWPERWSLDYWRRKQRFVGPYNWNRQFQQRPGALAGDVFHVEWVKYWSLDNRPPKSLIRYILVDPASSKKKGSDYTAMVVVGLGADQNYYVLDIIHDRLNQPERIQALFRLAVKSKPIRKVGYEKYGMMEDAQEIVRRKRAMFYNAFEVVELGGNIPKATRIGWLVGPFAAGRIYLPQRLPKTLLDGTEVDMTQVFVKELVDYTPGGTKKDDLLDALARIRDPGLLVSWPEVPDPEWEPDDEDEDDESGASGWMSA